MKPPHLPSPRLAAGAAGARVPPRSASRTRAPNPAGNPSRWPGTRSPQTRPSPRGGQRRGPRAGREGSGVRGSETPGARPRASLGEQFSLRAVEVCVCRKGSPWPPGSPTMFAGRGPAVRPVFCGCSVPGESCAQTAGAQPGAAECSAPNSTKTSKAVQRLSKLLSGVRLVGVPLHVERKLSPESASHFTVGSIWDSYRQGFGGNKLILKLLTTASLIPISTLCLSSSRL